MASYVQLGRGYRPNYQVASFHSHRRKVGGRGVATTLGLVAAVFAAGLLLGRLNTGPSHVRPAAPQPMQFYPG
jgi:hypothetical protein